jgi:hypothetical protein
VCGEHVLNWEAVIDDGVLEHVDVQGNIESASSHRCQLPKHHILGNTMAVILLSYGRGLHEDLHRFFE